MESGFARYSPWFSLRKRVAASNVANGPERKLTTLLGVSLSVHCEESLVTSSVSSESAAGEYVLPSLSVSSYLLMPSPCTERFTLKPVSTLNAISMFFGALPITRIPRTVSRRSISTCEESPV